MARSRFNFSFKKNKKWFMFLGIALALILTVVFLIKRSRENFEGLNKLSPYLQSSDIIEGKTPENETYSPTEYDSYSGNQYNDDYNIPPPPITTTTTTETIPCVVVVEGQNRERTCTQDPVDKKCYIEEKGGPSRKSIPYIVGPNGKALKEMGQVYRTTSHEYGTLQESEDSKNNCATKCQEAEDCVTYVWGMVPDSTQPKLALYHCRLYESPKDGLATRLVTEKAKTDSEWITVTDINFAETQETSNVKFITKDTSKVTRKLVDNYRKCKEECKTDIKCKAYSFNRSETTKIAQQAQNNNHGKSINSHNCLLFNTLDNVELTEQREMNWRSGKKGCGETQLPKISKPSVLPLTP